VRGECVGTPCYIAPELPLGQKATAQSDIYSLGCTLWFLLIGKPPYEARTKHDMMKMHVYAALPDIREIRPEIPPRLAETIQRACSKNPDDRFESADQFAKVLRTFTIPAGSGSSQRLPTLSGGGGSVTGSSPPWAPEPAMSASSTSLPNSSANLAPMMQSSANLGGSMSSSSSGVIAAPARASDSIEILGRKLPMSPILWAGIGTGAAVILIGIGVWIARGSSANGTAAAVPSAPQVSAPPAIRSGSNAVANGALDLGDEASAPGWFVPPAYKHAISFVSEDGNRFLRIKNEDTKATVFIDQKIKVEPTWTAVTVSARIRATNFKSGSGAAHDARVAMKFIDDNDQRVGNWPPVPTVKGDSPWVERTITADVPPGAKHLYLQLAVFYATGTVDFDDVKVIPQIKSTK
jgi:hypothetical protein